MLARDDLQAVGAAAGPQAHVEIASAAIERGWPVFIEKPPAATAAQAQALALASARSSGWAKARRMSVVMAFLAQGVPFRRGLVGE
jgi:myo-inositol 2-dehydrogenase/D-chiro-inositol 1-dehydrogenase